VGKMNKSENSSIKIKCEYCGGYNFAHREECRKCGAPVPNSSVFVDEMDLPEDTYWVDGGITRMPFSPYSEWNLK